MFTFQLDLQLQDEEGGDLSSFVTNGEWSLIGKMLFKIYCKHFYK